MKMHLKIIKGYEDHNHYMKGNTYREFTDFEETPNFDEFISYCKTHNGNMFFKKENIKIRNFNNMIATPKEEITFENYIKLINDTICESYRNNDHFEFNLHEFKKFNQSNYINKVLMPNGYEHYEKILNKFWEEGNK